MKQITFKQVNRLYPSAIVLGVKATFTDGAGGWKDVEYQGSAEDQVQQAIDEGASTVQLVIDHGDWGKRYPDYKTRELQV